MSDENQELATTRRRDRPTGGLTYCRPSTSTSRIDPDRGHEWQDLETTRLRLDGENDQRFRCSRCGRRRYLLPPPASEQTGGIVVTMPPGFPALTLQSVGYDVESGTYDGPVLTRIEVVNDFAADAPISVPHRAMKRFYNHWIQTAQRLRSNTPDAAPVPLKPFDELPKQALERVGQLASGRYPVSDHILSDPALIDLCKADPEDAQTRSQTSPPHWQELAIEPAFRSS